jgi:hypothetical protein
MLKDNSKLSNCLCKLASCPIVYVNVTWHSKKCVDGTLEMFMWMLHDIIEKINKNVER